MNKNGNAYWITYTAAAVALLIVVQAVTMGFGNMFLTGSCVNLLLILSVMTCGLKTGLWAAVLSPVVARLFGIGPLWSLIPFIILGNSALCGSWYMVMRGWAVTERKFCIIAIFTAAVAKFLVLYLGIVKLAIPYLLHIPQKQVTVIAQMFSLPQLATAIIGGILATVTLPMICRAIKMEEIL